MKRNVRAFWTHPATLPLSEHSHHYLFELFEALVLISVRQWHHSTCKTLTKFSKSAKTSRNRRNRTRWDVKTVELLLSIVCEWEFVIHWRELTMMLWSIFRRFCNRSSTFSRFQASKCAPSSAWPSTSGSTSTWRSSRRSAKSSKCCTTRVCCKFRFLSVYSIAVSE